MMAWATLRNLVSSQISKSLKGEIAPPGVRTHCIYGTVHQGSIIIGADGFHNDTRQTMRRLALQADTNANVNEENLIL